MVHNHAQSSHVKSAGAGLLFGLLAIGLAGCQSPLSPTNAANLAPSSLDGRVLHMTIGTSSCGAERGMTTQFRLSAGTFTARISLFGVGSEGAGRVLMYSQTGNTTATLAIIWSSGLNETFTLLFDSPTTGSWTGFDDNGCTREGDFQLQ